MTPSPSQTAQDLREAARLVQEHGHGTGEYVNPQGQLCAVGAIAVATGQFRRTFNSELGTWDFSHHHLRAIEDPRTDAAIAALAPLLPVACSDGRCTPDLPPFPPESLPKPPTPEAFHASLIGKDEKTVFHYNDFICEGGDELVLLLTQAAEKIEANLP